MCKNRKIPNTVDNKKKKNKKREKRKIVGTQKEEMCRDRENIKQININ